MSAKITAFEAASFGMCNSIAFLLIAYIEIVAHNLKKYDLIIVDYPPALGQSVAAIALAEDLIVAPVTPEEFSLSWLKISTEKIANIERTYKLKIPLRLVLNKFDTRTFLSHEVLITLIKHPIFGERLFKTYILASQDFPNSITNKQSIVDFIKFTSAKEDVDLLAREV